MWVSGIKDLEQRMRIDRHRIFMQSGVPVQYRGQKKSLTSTDNIVLEGAKIYSQQCAVCKGSQGIGDGQAAKCLSPSPALLAYMIQMIMSVDEYMMWTINEGGSQFGRSMPA